MQCSADIDECNATEQQGSRPARICHLRPSQMRNVNRRCTAPAYLISTPACNHPLDEELSALRRLTQRLPRLSRRGHDWFQRPSMPNWGLLAGSHWSLSLSRVDRPASTAESTLHLIYIHYAACALGFQKRRLRYASLAWPILRSIPKRITACIRAARSARHGSLVKTFASAVRPCHALHRLLSLVPIHSFFLVNSFANKKSWY